MSEQQVDQIIANIREELKYWDRHLWSFLSGPDMRNIIRYLVGMKSDNKYFVPRLPIAFNPYKATKPNKVRCIIITSLKGNTVESAEKYNYPMSPATKTICKVLSTISKEISIGREVYINPQPESWSRTQGVLQVSTAMTSELNGDHHYVLWKPWIAYVVNKLNELYPDTPVLFIGTDANQYRALIKSPHQYTVDTWPKVFHYGCWDNINDLLVSRGEKPIRWAPKPNPNAMTKEEIQKRKIDRWKRAKAIKDKREQGMSDEVRNRTKKK